MSIAISLLQIVLLTLMVWRAKRGKFLASYPLFYSYLIYTLSASVVVFIANHFLSGLHWTIWWRYFLISLIVEFGTLVEISDHLFRRYPAIRRMSRLFVAFICTTFLTLIVPSLFRSKSQTEALLHFGKLTCISKAIIVCMFLWLVYRYGLPLGKNVSGLIMGFSVFVGVNVANFALAEKLGRAAYATTFGWVGGISYTLSLFIWTVALWNHEPAIERQPAIRGGGSPGAESLADRLEQFNSTLENLLRK